MEIKPGLLFEPPQVIKERFSEIARDIEIGYLTVAKNVLSGVADVVACLDSQNWSRQSQARLLRSWLERRDRPDLQAELICQWIRFHAKDDCEAVTDCIELIPPEEVSIIGRAQKKGSQKIVYMANWRVKQRTVILKRLLDRSILPRELLSHPLSANHPNIVKTYTAANSEKEVFLIEERLHEVLNDNFRSSGLEETARLTYDIASALDHINQSSRVHGDVKPDNIGRHDDRFVLLDFGICRRADQFVLGMSATGSLRTRSPELLLAEKTHSIQSDLWALGAVVALATCKRFPLVDQGDGDVPRITNAEKRKAFEEMLKNRVQKEYDVRIENILSLQSDPRLKLILTKLLTREPSGRGTPAEILDLVRGKFAYALPQPSTPAAWRGSLDDEIKIVWATWSTTDALRRLPAQRRRALIARLEDLRDRSDGASSGQVKKLDDLLAIAKRVQETPQVPN